MSIAITMHTRDVADIVNRPHSQIVKDVRAMFIDLHEDHTLYMDGDGYRLNRRMTSILASGYSVLMRAKMFDRLEKLEAERSLLPDFSDPVIAARAWADAQEQLKLAAPKVALANRVADADNHQYIRDVAKQFNWRPKAFTEMLVREKLLYVTQNAHGRIKYPYSHHSDKFVVVQEFINGAMRPVTKITGVGVAYIADWIDDVDPWGEE